MLPTVADSGSPHSNTHPEHHSRPNSAENNGLMSDPGSKLGEGCEKLWEKLPKEMKEAVLTRLPIPDQLNYRRVSKAWDVLLNPKNPYKDVKR